MKIIRLRVRNFRSFDSDGIELDLNNESGYFVIMGANAAGKSNLLEALRWVTGDRYIGGDSIQPCDFHRGRTEETMEIEAEIDPPITYGDTFNKFHQIKFLRFEAKEYVKGEEKGDIRCDHVALTEGRTSVMSNLAVKVAKNRTLSAAEKEGKQQPRPLFVRDIRKKIPTYYLDNVLFSFHLTNRSGSLLSRFSRLLRDDLLREDNRIEWRDEEVKREKAVNDVIDELGSLLKTDRVDETLKAMASFMATQLQIPEDSLELEIGLPGGPELLGKIELMARDNQDCPKMPISRLGRGYSALAMVALFRALNNLNKEHHGAIVLIEEPEMFLGSHLRSVFATTLQEFARKGNQVIVVTHCPEFFDPACPQSAILIKKENAASKCMQWPSGKKSPPYDINLKFIEPNLNRLIFSKRILFVEGHDDYAAILASLNHLKIDPAFHGLEIIRIEGKGNIKHFIPYATHFGIPHATVLDKDAESILREIDPIQACWRTFDPDLEGVLNTAKVKENSIHVTNLVGSKAGWQNVKSEYPHFAKPLEDILTILDIPISSAK